MHFPLRTLYWGGEKHSNCVADGVNRIAYSCKLDQWQSQEKEPDFLFLHFASYVQFSEDYGYTVILN